MKTLPAPLLAAQQVPSGRPIARAALADNGRLHPSLLFTDSYTGGAVFAARCDDFYLRLRYTASGLDTLERQRITDPTVEADWETWTGFETNLASARGAAVFWTGTYAVALWQDATDRHLYYRRSTDGITWSAAALAHNTIAPYAASLGGVSGGAAQSGAVLHFNGGVYWCAYNPAADTWAAPESTGLAYDPAYSLEVAACYDAAYSRHLIVTNPVGAYAWARFALVVFARLGAGSYTTPRPFQHANRNNFQHLSLSQEQIGGYWWLAFYRSRGWGAGVYWLAASDDGLFYEDAVPTAIPAEPRLGLLAPLPGTSTSYLATERAVYESTPHTGWSDATVVRYSLTSSLSFSLSLSSRRPPVGLSLVLDNRDGTLTAPALHSTLTLQRGYRLDGADYWVDAGTFHVTGFRYLANDNVLEITAADASALPRAWTADAAFSFKDERLDTLVEACLALAGVHAVSFDGGALWAETVPSFTVLGGTDGRAALSALARRAPFELRINEDGSAYAFIPAASPASVYTYGAGGHAFWPGEFGERAAANFVAAIGSPPHTSAGDAYAAEALAAAGRRWARTLTDPRLTSAADAEALALAVLLGEQERARAGAFASPPNFALEPGDVVDFSGGLYAALAGPWRVEQIEETFNVEQQRPFVQRVSVRGTSEG